MTEISLIVTLNNQFTSPHLTPLLPPPAFHIHPIFIKNWRADRLIPVQSNILKLNLIFPFLSSWFQGDRSLIRKENSYRNFCRRLRVRLHYRTLPREEHSPMPCSGIFTRQGRIQPGGGGTGARAPPPPRQWLQAWVYTYYFIMR